MKNLPGGRKTLLPAARQIEMMMASMAWFALEKGHDVIWRVNNLESLFIFAK